MGLICGLIGSQLLVGFDIQIMSKVWNIEFKLIVMCNLCDILSSESVLENYKPRLYCSLDDRANFCTVYHTYCI